MDIVGKLLFIERLNHSLQFVLWSLFWVVNILYQTSQSGMELIVLIIVKPIKYNLEKNMCML